MKEKRIIQLYSGNLAQSIYENANLKVENEMLQEELQEFKQVLDSDETLHSLFYEQKEKLLRGE